MLSYHFINSIITVNLNNYLLVAHITTGSNFQISAGNEVLCHSEDCLFIPRWRGSCWGIP